MRVTANRYLFYLQNTPSCQHSSLRLRRPAATAKALHQTIRGNTTVRNCCGRDRTCTKMPDWLQFEAVTNSRLLHGEMAARSCLFRQSNHVCTGMQSPSWIRCKSQGLTGHTGRKYACRTSPSKHGNVACWMLLKHLAANGNQTKRCSLLNQSHGVHDCPKH